MSGDWAGGQELSWNHHYVDKGEVVQAQLEVAAQRLWRQSPQVEKPEFDG